MGTEIKLSGTLMTSSQRAGLPTGNVILAANFLDIPLVFVLDILSHLLTMLTMKISMAKISMLTTAMLTMAMLTMAVVTMAMLTMAVVKISMATINRVDRMMRILKMKMMTWRILM